MDNKSVRIVRLDIDEMDDFSGVDAIALVEEPAIESNFIYFSKQEQNKHIFESYSDYPDAVSNNAKRGIELNEKVNNKCATQVGKVRAQQLAKKEPISVETIKRMYSYLSRAEAQYIENEGDNEACSVISYLLWGGLAAKRWSEAKLKELGLFEGDISPFRVEDYDIDVSGLPDYINEPSGSLIVKLDECTGGCGDCNCYAEIGPRGGIKESPKAPKSKTPGDGKKGSDKNKPGAAGTTRGGVKVPQRVLDSLQKKSDEFNERYKEKLGYGVNVGMLKAVYQRGVGAYQTSHSPDVKSAEQWGQARVNAFLYLVKNGRPQNKKYTTDYDLLPTKHPKRVENSKFVKPTAGESEAEFIGRCVPVLQKEGYETDQALAICYADWRDRYDEVDLQVEKYVEELFDFLGYIDGLPVYSTIEEAVGVAEIAGCKGYHEHNVGDFIVYMPCETHDPSYDTILEEAHKEWIQSRMIDGNTLEESELEAIMDYLDSVALDVEFSQDTYAGVTGGKQRRNVGDSVSFLDTPTTKIRYRYTENPTAPSNKSGTSREFCKAMMSRRNNVYRKEDINNASLSGINRELGPGGNAPYNLFLYRGGNNCRHIWQEVRFVLNERGQWVDSTISVGSPVARIAPRDPQTPLTDVIGALGINLSKQDFAEQQIVIGPAMIPDKLIYRIDKDGEYFVYFPKEAIKKIAYKYMEKKYTDATNIEHNSFDPLQDTYVVESWIVTDPENDKSRIYSNGETYPEGTWMVAMKVKNREVWNDYIKTGLVKGFSVEGYFIDMLINQKYQ